MGPGSDRKEGVGGLWSEIHMATFKELWVQSQGTASKTLLKWNIDFIIKYDKILQLNKWDFFNSTLGISRYVS